MLITSYKNYSYKPQAHEINFGYESKMRDIATKYHVHCAYGGEELNEEHRATAEHVKTHSSGGADNDSNFLPVCREHNQERGCKSLKKFMRWHPNTLDNIKRTILELNEIILPDFNGHKWAENIVKAVEKELKTELNLDLDSEDSLEKFEKEHGYERPKAKSSEDKYIQQKHVNIFA